ncbi:hypothetical protein C8R46DRAFT_519119 [Mycena filopes]|nr:hypothetical protein C8R46DRAFT_519119 [Mycena filopes]
MNQFFGWCSRLPPARARTTTRLPTDAALARHFKLSCRNDAFSRAYSVKMRTNHRNALISSLRWENLKSSDYVDLSGLSTSCLAFSSRGRDVACYYRNSHGRELFPDSARGYLYYRTSPLSLAGSIRLRVDTDNANGHDLLLPSGLPWQIGLPQLVQRKQYQSLFLKLLKEKLVTHPEVRACRRLFPEAQLYPSAILFSLDQLFSISMQQADLRLIIVGFRQAAIYRRHRRGLFVKQNIFGDPSPRYPFKGRILARFELSADKRRVFMRIVKIVEPIVCLEPGYDGRVVAPEEGGLLSYNSYRGVRCPAPTPWSLSMDEETTSVSAEGLRLLI